MKQKPYLNNLASVYNCGIHEGHIGNKIPYNVDGSEHLDVHPHFGDCVVEHEIVGLFRRCWIRLDLFVFGAMRLSMF
ncbi:hypothetical protein E5288_WYG017287 [Bos mutus]|uniref:Uncharacterized protein n=1 Tax=Bos mutus TaxID=72004 RepID=A0A6B0RQ38_9CETA|nr:hypothetical protein [Bos mutus]